MKTRSKIVISLVPAIVTLAGCSGSPEEREESVANTEQAMCPTRGCPGDGDPTPRPPKPRPQPQPQPEFPANAPPKHDPNCPDVAPVPADYTVLQCKAGQVLDTKKRCFSVLSNEECDSYINAAFDGGLIDQKAKEWALYQRWCPIVVNSRIIDVCPPGCFAEGTLIQGSSGNETPIEKIVHGDQVASLATDGDSLLATESRTVLMTIAGPERNPMYQLDLDNGRSLTLTEHHPVVLADGRLVPASRLRPSDELAGKDGARVSINAITRPLATGDVRNLLLEATSTEGHILIAEGVLVGDNWLQNSLSDDAAAIELRR